MSDSQDDPRPPPLRRVSAALRRTGGRLGRASAAARDRLRELDERQRRPPRVPESETVRIDQRRHPFMLVLPLVRTLAGITVLVSGLRFQALLALGLLIALWAGRRLRLGLRRTATVTGALTAGFVVLALVLGPWWAALALLLWLGEDVADWYFDRLVVTDRRLYRCYGVVAQHSPSIALTAIAYIDASVTPLYRFLRYGTLSLDSVAQRDAPLSRFDFIPKVVPVRDRILELRSRAMPKYPPGP